MKKPVKRILLVAGLIAVAVLTYIGVGIYRLTYHGIPEAYAAWDCASLIIEHLETHDGQWPQSWGELLSAAQTLPHGDRMMGGTNTPASIPRLVRVDWSADPQQLARTKHEAGSIPFHVVIRPDGSDFKTVWTGTEPNTLICDYLKRRYSSGEERGP